MGGAARLSRLRPGPASSTWCTTTSTGCRWPSPGTAGPAADHHPRVLRPRHPAGVPGGRLGVRVDLRRRPGTRAGLRRHDPPRHRPRARSPFSPVRRRGPRHPRPHPSGQGHRRGDRDRPAGRPAADDLRARCRTSAISPNGSQPHVDGDGSATSARSVRSERSESSARPPRCCTRSPSRSRSGCRSSRRWLRHAGHRVSPGLDGGDGGRGRDRVSGATMPRRPRRPIEAAAALDRAAMRRRGGASVRRGPDGGRLPCSV